MAMLITPRAIGIMAKIAILATIVMANGNFSMAMRVIQLKSIKKLDQ